MSARGAAAGECGHASCCCAARARGLDAQGQAAYEFLRAAVRDGVPAAVYTHRLWSEMPAGDRQFFTDLVNAAEDAFWLAWAR